MQGDRLKEAQNINKSLSALGDVIQVRGGRWNLGLSPHSLTRAHLFRPSNNAISTSHIVTVS